MELDAFAAIKLVKAFLGSLAQPFKLGLVFPLSLFKEPETFAHYLTRVAVPAGVDAGLDEVIEVIREGDVTSWHREALAYDYPIRTDKGSR